MSTVVAPFEDCLAANEKPNRIGNSSQQLSRSGESLTCSNSRALSGRCTDAPPATRNREVFCFSLPYMNFSALCRNRPGVTRHAHARCKAAPTFPDTPQSLTKPAVLASLLEVFQGFSNAEKKRSDLIPTLP
jgi:hypothetical protein